MLLQCWMYPCSEKGESDHKKWVARSVFSYSRFCHAGSKDNVKHVRDRFLIFSLFKVRQRDNHVISNRAEW